VPPAAWAVMLLTSSRSADSWWVSSSVSRCFCSTSCESFSERPDRRSVPLAVVALAAISRPASSATSGTSAVHRRAGRAGGALVDVVPVIADLRCCAGVYARSPNPIRVSRSPEDPLPKSRVRKKAAYTPPPTRSKKKQPSPPWVAPLMVACFLIGIAWLVAYYITGTNAPVFGTIGNWSLLIGFGFIVVGFGISTQWR
jgi:uncharacterized membrane protein (DUF485 family)